jgi:hypothetical protein
VVTQQDEIAQLRATAIRLAATELRTVVATSEDAARVIGTLTPGCRVSGLTMGQISLIHLLRAVVEQTGPADVIISAWTQGIRDTETAAWMLANGQFRSLYMLLDKSYPKFNPRYCARLIELYGPDVVLLTKTHAKFIVVQNEHWNIALRGSMNLNTNKRIEQFDLDDSAELCGLYRDFAEVLLRQAHEGGETIQDVLRCAPIEGVGSKGVAEQVAEVYQPGMSVAETARRSEQKRPAPKAGSWDAGIW